MRIRPAPAEQSTFTPPANPPLIGWHEAARAILFFNDPPKPGIGYPTQILRDCEWAADDADFRRTLPRIDVSPLARPR
jgi:hypothetical protein